MKLNVLKTSKRILIPVLTLTNIKSNSWFMFKHKLLYFILNNKRMKPALFLPKLEAGYGSLNGSDWIPDPRRIGYILRDSERDGLPSGWYSSQQRELFVCIQHSSVTWARTEAFKMKKEKNVSFCKACTTTAACRRDGQWIESQDTFKTCMWTCLPHADSTGILFNAHSIYPYTELIYLLVMQRTCQGFAI